MSQLLHETQGGVEEVVANLTVELQRILEYKRKDVEWKLSSVKEAFVNEVFSKVTD